MKTTEKKRNQISIEFSKDELRAVCNALNEVCNGIEVSEFDEKMGIKIQEANKLLSAFGLSYDELSKLTLE